jgi:hypothetical protein
MGLAADLLQKVTIGARRLRESTVQGVGAAEEFVRKNPATSAATVAGGVVAGVTAIQIVRKASKKSPKAKKKSRKARKTKPRTRRKVSKKKKSGARRQRKPYTAGKGRDTSTRRIRFTKNNQPYVILKSGKARFIKKASVARMRKRKGGKY